MRFPWRKSGSDGLHASGLPAAARPAEHREPVSAPKTRDDRRHEHFELEQVACASNDMEGEMIEGLLRAEGIKCMLQPTTGFTPTRGAMIGPCGVLVRAEDVQRAREVLATSESS